MADDCMMDRRTFFHTGIAAAGMLLYSPEALLPQDNNTAQQPSGSLEELPVLKKNRISFAQAKKGSDALKIKYLDQLLVEEYRLIEDSKRNKNGFVSAWYYWPDKGHKKRAMDAIADEVRNDGAPHLASYVIKWVELDLPRLRVMPRYKGSMGHKQKLNYLIIGNTFFDVEAEDEALSTIDWGYAVLFAREFNIKVAGKEIDMKNRVLNAYSNHFVDVYAAQAQLENILGGKRKQISETFHDAVVKKYLDARREYSGALEEMKSKIVIEVDGKSYDTPVWKPAYETAKTFLEESDAAIKKLGYIVENGELKKCVDAPQKKDDSKK